MSRNNLDFFTALKFCFFVFFFNDFDMLNHAQAKEYPPNFTLKHTQTTLKDRKQIL